MFTNDRRQEERTGRYGTPRLQYLQELVTQFQNSTNEETKEKVVANLANFAYDPYNYTFLRQLNVLELFLDCITEPNEKLVEFGIGGICNSCADPANAEIIVRCEGIPLAIQCLSSAVRNTVNYALGSLYYLCNRTNRDEILKPEMLELISRYAASEAVSVGFSNLAKAFIDKHWSVKGSKLCGPRLSLCDFKMAPSSSTTLELNIGGREISLEGLKLAIVDSDSELGVEAPQP